MSHAAICRIIEEKCRKLQYDEAERWAEFLYSLDVDAEEGPFCLAYIYALRSKYRAAAKILSGLASVRAKYVLATCLYEVAEFEQALEVLDGCASQLETALDQRRQTIFGVPITAGDVHGLCGKIAAALGNDELGREWNRRAFEADPTLLLAMQSFMSAGRFIPALR